MFSKKICASLCALGMLGAVNANTKVSAAGTFQSIANQNRDSWWNCFKVVLGASVFNVNQYFCETGCPQGTTSYGVIAFLSLIIAGEGLLGSLMPDLDGAKIKVFEKIAKNDPVYFDTYKFLKCAPVELTDENVKGVIDNIKNAREVYKKFKDRDLDPAQRLLAKDEYEDAVKNLKEIAGKKNSEGNDEQTSDDKPQLYKRRNR